MRHNSLRTKKDSLVRDISQSLGKLPPQAPDVEQAVLGAMILIRQAVHDVIDIIEPETFYSEQHQEIFQAIVDLYRNDGPVDMRTVKEQLSKNGKLELIGGIYYLTELTDKVSSSANIEYHARILIEKKILRDLITTASTIHQDAYDASIDPPELLETSIVKLEAITGKFMRGNFESIGEISKGAIKHLTDIQGQTGLTGVATGFTKLDRITGGWQPTDLIIIASRPGMGKTALMLSAALNAAMIEVPIGIFELEMANHQLVLRAYSGLAEIDNTRIMKNYITMEELFKIGDSDMRRLRNAPIYVDDNPKLTIFEFRARARRLVREKNVKAIYVDYLQLMDGDPDAGTRDQEVGSITRGLKRVAKELKIPVIAFSQLSRAVEQRGGDKRPQLSDLRESGSIEQDADMVIFLYRAEYYKIEQDAEGMPTQGVMEAIIAKHRSGPLDTIPLKFIGKYTKVVDWDNQPQAPTSTFGGTMRTIDRPAPKLDSGYQSSLTDDSETPF